MSESPYKGEPGKPYRPGNGTEGCMFTDQFCDKCWHDRATESERSKNPQAGCDILARSMGYNIGDAEYPAEWVYSDDGWPTCTAFHDIESGEPKRVDTQTSPMFAED